MVQPAISEGVGYGVVVGLGLGFAVLMICISYILKKYNSEKQTSEHFNTASHSVRTGLVASAVVSSWTWASTLLTSAQKTYQYGVSGAFWYASGACVQILLFTVLAIELKRKAPNAHTFLEVVRARCGPLAHTVFIFFAYVTNILVMAMLLCGGSATIASVTGVNTVAACFLLPVGVIIYTIFGGIKATFLTDYIHTIIILVILIMFSLSAYSASDKIGSPGKLYDMLKAAGDSHPVEGNAEGSYLTMRSREGAIFFIINLAGNFGTVFVDNGYWQKAIAANPASALPGYILGGISWFAIPWLAATTTGLVCLALEAMPYFPTYPNRMTDLEVSQGLALPYGAIALMGKTGANATVVLVFMAVTSAASSELIAVSSIFTYDIYKQYVRRNAGNKELLYTGHVVLIGFGFLMSAFATGLYYGNVSMGYLYLLMGVLVCPAVIPATCVMLSTRASKLSITVSPILGLISSIISWLVVASTMGSGKLTIETTGANNPMLAGNVVGLLSPILYLIIFSIVKPEKYDFNDLLNKFKMHYESEEEEILQKKKLNRASIISKIAATGVAAVFIILWPWPMYGSKYIFSKRFFTGWVVVGLIWIFFTVFSVGIFPLWEGRKDIYVVVKRMFESAFGTEIVENEDIGIVEGMNVENDEEKGIEKRNEKENGSLYL